MWKKLMVSSADRSLKGHEAYASYQMQAWKELSIGSAKALASITESPLVHYEAESDLKL